MWKYRCKKQLISLLAAFLVGAALGFFAYQNVENLELLQSLVPAEVFSYISEHPYLIYLSTGLFLSGLANVFIVGNFLITEWSVPPFLFFILAMIFPTYLIEVGMLLVPVSVIILLYGWLSLRLQHRNFLKKHNLANEDELIRIYLIHHPLVTSTEPLAREARRINRTVTLIMALGLVALACVFLLIDNYFISILMILLYFIAWPILNRYRASAFIPISSLLYQQCDPEACISALLYYCKKGSHYRLSHQPLLAKSLIYLDDPSLAQDILSTYPRPSVQSELSYWSLMGSVYYLLADENGLERCKQALSTMKLGFGRMSVMIRSEEQNAIQNKLNLMNGDFSACKQYYLEQLKRAVMPLNKADCYYYIALISFVQKDYILARDYFNKTVSIGNKLYFVEKARNYLKIIDSLQPETENAQNED